jgi:hypothetical protein
VTSSILPQTVPTHVVPQKSFPHLASREIVAAWAAKMAINNVAREDMGMVMTGRRLKER